MRGKSSIGQVQFGEVAKAPASRTHSKRFATKHARRTNSRSVWSASGLPALSLFHGDCVRSWGDEYEYERSFALGNGSLVSRLGQRGFGGFCLVVVATVQWGRWRLCG